MIYIEISFILSLSKIELSSQEVMHKKFLIVFALIFFISCQRQSSNIEPILRLENRRVACDSLLTFLNYDAAGTRARAVEALGKLQDPGCLEALIHALQDPNEDVRLQAAFAIGQLGLPEAEFVLIDHLKEEKAVAVQKRIIEALGKIGTKTSIPILIEYFKNHNPLLRAEAALSCGHMALRNLFAAALTDSLTLLIYDDDAEVRWKACYSLMRIAEDQNNTLNEDALFKATTDQEPWARMFAVQALGKIASMRYLDRLALILREDQDWHVRVDAANALGNYPLSQVVNFLILMEPNHHVRISIIRAFGSSAANEPGTFQQTSREFMLAKNQLEDILDVENDSTWTVPEKEAALISYAQLMRDSGIEVILEFAEHPDVRLRAKAMEALGETHSPRAFQYLKKNYDNAPTRVRIAILQALTKIDDLRKQEVYLNALKEGDVVLTALAAQGLSQEKLDHFHLQHIIDAYQKLPKPVDLEAAQMIFQAMAKYKNEKAVPILEEALAVPDRVYSRAAAQALEQITGEDYSAKVATFTRPHSSFSYAEIKQLKEAKAVIETRHGRIEFKLLTDLAPLTVLNFVTLARNQFYDGLTFHRVVPNFVIQGGDPRSDSWGSPGYAIRSEFNQHPYLRGTVGMASAGKDTEGSQFFITHSPQPHLDGRYTVFGQVTSGMEVVDAIQEGDTLRVVQIR